jgi:hypothetical protein
LILLRLISSHGSLEVTPDSNNEDNK